MATWTCLSAVNNSDSTIDPLFFRFHGNERNNGIQDFKTRQLWYKIWIVKLDERLCAHLLSCWVGFESLWAHFFHSVLFVVVFACLVQKKSMNRRKKKGLQKWNLHFSIWNGKTECLNGLWPHGHLMGKVRFANSWRQWVQRWGKDWNKGSWCFYFGWKKF